VCQRVLSIFMRGVNTFKIWIFILLAFVSLVTCGWQCGSMGQNQYEYYPYSWNSGSSNAVVITGSYSANLTDTVNPGGVDTSVYFEWGSTNGWSSSTPRSVGNGNLDVPVTQTVTSLLAGTTYYYRLVILVGSTLTYGDNQSFTTPGRPSCTTEIVTNISSLSATLNAIVNPNGLTTTAYFQWGLSYAFGNNTAEQVLGSGTNNVNVLGNIIGLSPDVTYFYRAVSVNAEGTVYGNTRTFTSGPPSPIATTAAATDVTYNSAVLNGWVNPNNQETTVNFQWGQTTAYGNTTLTQVIPASTSNVSIIANLPSLSSSTTYYFRLTARNPVGDGYGARLSFTTPPPPPIATTTPATTFTYNSAILTGTVNPNGLPTTVYFQWGTSIPYGNSTAIQSIGTGITNVSAAVTLTGNTSYNYRIAATNSSGTSYGSNQSFTTPIPPPTATTISATSITASSGRMNSSVNPNGGATTVYFQWGTTIAYGNVTTSTLIGSGNNPIAYGWTLTGLTSSTTYYFRIVAINGLGTSYGINRTFTTSAQVPTVVTLPASEVTSSTFRLNATVNPNGDYTTAYFQFGFTTSYGYTSSAQSIGNGRTPITVTAYYPLGVTPGATYYFRIVAYNSGGPSFGAQQSFTTPLAGAPNVTTQAADNITSTNARLSGIVNSNGQTTTVYFRYRRTTPQGAWNVQSPPFDNGNGTTDWIVSAGAPSQQLLPALSPNTTYSFQVYATNAAGTTYGVILSFTTLP